jgi:hypothetical protein
MNYLGWEEKGAEDDLRLCTPWPSSPFWSTFRGGARAGGRIRTPARRLKHLPNLMAATRSRLGATTSRGWKPLGLTLLGQHQTRGIGARTLAPTPGKELEPLPSLRDAHRTQHQGARSLLARRGAPANDGDLVGQMVQDSSASTVARGGGTRESFRTDSLCSASVGARRRLSALRLS